MCEALDDGMREVVGRVAQCFAGKFEEETACFVGVGGREGIGFLSVRKIFSRATRDGRGARGFCGGFFLGTTGGHDGVWRETGSKRKENFYASCFGKFAFCRISPLIPESFRIL